MTLSVNFPIDYISVDILGSICFRLQSDDLTKLKSVSFILPLTLLLIKYYTFVYKV